MIAKELRLMILFIIFNCVSEHLQYVSSWEAFRLLFLLDNCLGLSLLLRVLFLFLLLFLMLLLEKLALFLLLLLFAFGIVLTLVDFIKITETLLTCF